MTDKPISPLRQRMIENMTARHFAERPRRTISDTSRTSRPSSAARPIPPAPKTFVCFNSI